MMQAQQISFMRCQHTAKAATFMQQVECLVDVSKGHVVGNVLVHLDFLQWHWNFLLRDKETLIQQTSLFIKQYLIHVLLNKPWDLGSALETSESCSLPDTASDKLEWPCGDLLARCSNTNNDRGSPALQEAF